MRAYLDPGGRTWDVLVSKASYGQFHILFAARDEHEVRRVPLDVPTALDAEQYLLDLDDERLAALFGQTECAT